MYNFNWKNVKSEKIKGKYINPFNNTDKNDLCQDFTNTFSFITCNILMHVFWMYYWIAHHFHNFGGILMTGEIKNLENTYNDLKSYVLVSP